MSQPIPLHPPCATQRLSDAFKEATLSYLARPGVPMEDAGRLLIGEALDLAAWTAIAYDIDYHDFMDLAQELFDLATLELGR